MGHICRKRACARPLAEPETDPLEQLLLTAYPNPFRKGCPGHDALAKLAATRGEDEACWTHVRHCSPCFREFKQMRDARWRREEIVEWLIQTQESDSREPEFRPN